VRGCAGARMRTTFGSERFVSMLSRAKNKMQMPAADKSPIGAQLRSRVAAPSFCASMRGKESEGHAPPDFLYYPANLSYLLFPSLCTFGVSHVRPISAPVCVRINMPARLRAQRRCNYFQYRTTPFLIGLPLYACRA
jgi:hypothetical protein